ncbi:hypothetical protein GCM10009821_04990 [Aeromicrobium halocynthiae]|uniref:Uncharacterized protein n=1 Tax=Aeromicrobium halocynthiae TaxID=560557 RepID=A0ABN2VS36_9ACTN
MTAEPIEPDHAQVGTVGQELALLVQLLASRSTVPSPVTTLLREHPELVETAADTVLAWVRTAQDVLGDAGSPR